jgi:hypothetical protein
LNDAASLTLRRLLRPRYYTETSARTGANVAELFAAVARMAVRPGEVPPPAAPEAPP